MTEEDEEFNRIEREAAMRMEAVSATVAKREWVGLTEDEIDEIFNNWPRYHLDHCEFAQVIEAKLKEKNNG